MVLKNHSSDGIIKPGVLPVYDEPIRPPVTPEKNTRNDIGKNFRSPEMRGFSRFEVCVQSLFRLGVQFRNVSRAPVSYGDVAIFIELFDTV